MTRSSFRPWLMALACLAACGSGRAERPIVGDAEDSVAAGDCEFETMADRQTSRAAPPEPGWSAQLDCGIGWRTELLAGYGRRRGEGGRDQALGIEGKTALGIWGLETLAWSIEYGWAAARPGDGRWRASETFWGVVAVWHPSPTWAVEASIGPVRDRPERRTHTAWLLAAERELVDALEARIECIGDDHGHAAVGMEWRYEFWRDRARVSLSYAAGTRPERERRAGVGLTFEF